jgi:hypothetical protein
MKAARNWRVMVSPAYLHIVTERVNKAMAKRAGQEDFRLAECSLVALGWLALHGSDAKSLALATKLRDAAGMAGSGRSFPHSIQ